ncbi:MAG: hypothetical protein V4579_03640 [Pseudomonadota bacterium]
MRSVFDLGSQLSLTIESALGARGHMQDQHAFAVCDVECTVVPYDHRVFHPHQRIVGEGIEIRSVSLPCGYSCIEQLIFESIVGRPRRAGRLLSLRFCSRLNIFLRVVLFDLRACADYPRKH